MARGRFALAGREAAAHIWFPMTPDARLSVATAIRKVELMSGPLEGWRVLDLSQGIAGPYVTKLCADYGADVLKVERPGFGDVSRRMGPFPHDDPHPDKSGMFLTLNTG